MNRETLFVKANFKSSVFIKTCYKTPVFSCFICRILRSPYLCTVFFIVLDLRLTKVGVQRYSFFYALMSRQYDAVAEMPSFFNLCTVFFIVLDLRLTKVGVQRYSFFYALMSRQYDAVAEMPSFFNKSTMRSSSS